MTKNIKTIAIVVGIVGVGYFAYKFFFVKSKEAMAKEIIALGYYNQGLNGLLSFGDDFIKAWYEGVKKGDKTFTLSGVSYNTQGGKKTA